MFASQQRLKGTPHASRWTVRLLLLLLLLSARSAAAQTAPEPIRQPPGEPTYTLHVYADLLQVPTLVLTGAHTAWTGLSRNDFLLRVDDGPPFHPTTLHVEGNEPLTLAIVLDASGSQADVLPAFRAAIPALFPTGLLPHDHVTIYALDCQLIRSSNDIQADPKALQEGIANALAAPNLHKPGDSHATCRSHKRLLASLATVIAVMGELPGRRALLVLSDGADSGSKATFRDVEQLADSRSVAVFGLRKNLEFIENIHSLSVHLYTDDEFGVMCSNTGGVVLNAQTKSLPAQLTRFTTFLRQRYVLEFPRPVNGTAGLHHLNVTLTNGQAIVNATGIQAPVRDAKLMSDPTTVPTDTSRMPVQGGHSGLPQPH